MTSKLQYEKVLGSGSFGQVYLCKRSDGSKLAVKRMFLSKGTDHIGVVNLKELNTLSLAIDHPNLMSATNVWFENPGLPIRDLDAEEKAKCAKKNREYKVRKTDKLYVGMHLADTDLISLWENKMLTKFSLDLKIDVAIRMLNGLEYLHQNNIVHRDIKPNNVLIKLSEDKNTIQDVWLSDYGLSRPVKMWDDNSTVTGTDYYHAPEHIVVQDRYDRAMDIWAMGVTIVELLLEEVLFEFEEHDDPIQRLIKIFKITGVPDKELFNRIVDMDELDYDNIMKDVKVKGLQAKMKGSLDDATVETSTLILDLVNNMMQLDWTKRFTVTQCLDHALFDSRRSDIKRLQVVESPLGNPGWVPEGIAVFKGIFANLNKQDLHRNTWIKMLFLALDIYHRVSQYINSNKKDKESQYLAATRTHPAQVAAACLYIAVKYYRGARAPPFHKMCSKMEHVDVESKSKIETVERKILRILDYRITRTSVYDHIRDEADADTIYTTFCYLMESDYWKYTPNEIATVIRSTLPDNQPAPGS